MAFKKFDMSFPLSKKLFVRYTDNNTQIVCCQEVLWKLKLFLEKDSGSCG